MTSWKLSPDALLKRLLNPSYDFPRLPPAFILGENGQPSHIPSLQWGEIANEIKLLDEELRDKNLPKQEDRKEWRRRSIEEISQYKAYIWFDEFENWFYRSPYFCQEHWIDEIDGELKQQSVELCLNPLLPSGLGQYFKNQKAKILKSNVSHEGVLERAPMPTTSQMIDGANNPDAPEVKERTYTTWLRDTWELEGQPTGALFFKKLKDYKGKNESPILDWYCIGAKKAGITLKTLTTVIDHYPREQIQKKASQFKKESQQQKTYQAKNMSSKKTP